MNQKGFTLVEVLLSMGLFSIVALCVIFFLNVGIKTGKSAQSQIDVQTQSQVILNQLTSFTMEGNDSVSTETEDAVVYKIFQNDKTTKQTTWETILLYRKAEEKLYYYELNTASSVAEIENVKKELTDSASVISVGELMGENVKKFSVDCSNWSMVSFSVTITIRGNTFTGTSSAKCRSKRVAAVTPIA